MLFRSIRVDVSAKYDKENNRTYTNFNIYDFEIPNAQSASESSSSDSIMNAVDDGEVETDEDKLPY